ncbi:hypothetical protein E8E13_008545 [Curvularia kusanoi]|uniref:Rhodopsin domain-containing protein n=1 Tax=Curvularia kusanoi TaxID=90978 RepID=A0A9P4W7D1_CURKU|nr:hypothetical protein E8E13_008545 [Curvularia kusanoi]
MCSTSTDRLIRLTRFAIYATITLIIGAYSSAFLVSIFQCLPIRSTWTKNIEGTCINLPAFRMSTAIFNLLTSILVISIPIPALTRLSNHRPEVKQLLALILLGLVHTGLTLARLVIMFFPDPLTKTEPQYTHVYNNVLAVVEMHTGILVATLVVMRPAFCAMARVVGGRYGAGEKMACGRSDEGDAFWGERAHGNGRKEVRYAILETTEIQVLRDAAQLDHLRQCSQGAR